MEKSSKTDYLSLRIALLEKTLGLDRDLNHITGGILGAHRDAITQLKEHNLNQDVLMKDMLNIKKLEKAIKRIASVIGALVTISGAAASFFIFKTQAETSALQDKIITIERAVDGK